MEEEEEIFAQETIEEILYNCTDCPSSIELISLENDTIEFKCIKENKIIKLPIQEEYLEKMKKFNLNEINNEKCVIHKSKYISYCLDCNCHLCKECLKSRNHINHKKNHLIEIQPTNEELNIFKEVIEHYKKKFENLWYENENIKQELKKELKDNKNIIKEKKEKNIKANKNNEKNEIKKITESFLNDIDEIKNKYKKEIKERKNKCNIDKFNIIKKYKLLYEKENIYFENKLIELNIRYNEKIKKLENKDEIKNYENMKIINERIYYTYNKYNNNYYNALNINNILLEYNKNEFFRDKIMKKILRNNYNETILKLKKEKNEKRKKEEESNFNIAKIIEEYENKLDILRMKYEKNQKTPNEIKNQNIITRSKKLIDEVNSNKINNPFKEERQIINNRYKLW